MDAVLLLIFALLDVTSPNSSDTAISSENFVHPLNPFVNAPFVKRLLMFRILLDVTVNLLFLKMLSYTSAADV